MSLGFYDQFTIKRDYNSELEQKIQQIENIPPSSTSNDLSLGSMINTLSSVESLYPKLEISYSKNLKHYFSTEADEDPFAGIGDGLEDAGDDMGDATFPADDSVSFDSFEDSSGDMFGDWGESGTDEEGDRTRAKALEVSRSDLLEESHNLGMFVRRVIPKKIKGLTTILENNIVVINKLIYDKSKHTNDLNFVKDGYQEILDSVKDYLDVIDSKTFDDIFADYVSFLSLIDSVNTMYEKVVKVINKQ